MKLGAKVAVDLELGICGRGLLCLLLVNKGMTGTTVMTTASVPALSTLVATEQTLLLLDWPS